MLDNLGEIGHIHVADVPGRHKPGTGEMNYTNTLSAIDDTGYDGHIGFEFTPKHDEAQAFASIHKLL